MKWFHDLKIATKLMISFAAVLALAVLLGIASFTQMGALNRASADLSRNWMPSVQAVLTMRTQLGDIRRWELAHLLTSDTDRMALFEKRLAEARDVFRKTDEAYAKLINSPEEQAVHAEFLKLWEQFLGYHAKLLELSRNNMKEEGKAFVTGDSAKVMSDLNDRVEKLVKINIEGGTQAGKNADEIYDKGRLIIIVALAVNIFLGLMLAWWIARLVSRPLRTAVGVAQQVASGDLTAKIEVSSRDETGELMQALKT
jgi:methyl-accepting chemotaxis protein